MTSSVVVLILGLLLVGLGTRYRARDIRVHDSSNPDKFFVWVFFDLISRLCLYEALLFTGLLLITFLPS